MGDSRPAPARLIDIATSARDADTLLAANETGLLRSTDRSANWVPAQTAAAAHYAQRALTIRMQLTKILSGLGRLEKVEEQEW